MQRLPSGTLNARRVHGWEWHVAVAAVVILAVVSAMAVAPPARADESQYLEFYTPPGSATAGATGRPDPHRAFAFGARTLRSVGCVHGYRNPNDVPQL